MFICQILDLNHDFYDNFVESLFEIISLDKCQPFSNESDYILLTFLLLIFVKFQ